MLRNLHIAAATIHLISALLSWIIHVDIESAITLPKHIHTGKTTTTEYEVWFNTNPIIWISINEFITMFSHVIAIFYLLTHDGKQTFESPRRAVEYCITAALLQCAIMLGMGAVTAQDIIFIIVTNVALQLLGYVIDLYREAKRWLLVIGFLLLISQMQYIIFNAARIEGISTGYYIVMAIIYVLFYTGFGVLKLIETVYADEIYVLMSLTSKVVLSWVLIGNLFEGFKELGVTTSPDYTHLDWRAIQISLIAIGSIGLAIGSTIFLRRTRKSTPSFRELRNLRY